MEKASEVYNKLKLRFVGKSDVPGKPQTDDKETEDNDKEPEEEGKQKIQAHFGSTGFYNMWIFFPPGLIFLFWFILDI